MFALNIDLRHGILSGGHGLLTAFVYEVLINNWSEVYFSFIGIVVNF
jgi:hypothetical protein